MADSEFEIIRKYFSNITAANDRVVRGPGDDAAVVRAGPGNELVISMDTLVSGVHFSAAADPFDIGFKSLAVNVSDIAAMAGDPLWVTLSLTLPEFDSDWLQRFSSGFAGLANQYRISLVGGDLSRGPLSITVQIAGEVPAGKALLRSTATPGDGIYVTGCLGAAALALSVSRGDVAVMEMVPATCMERLDRPSPRVATGLAIRHLASAAIDISDGLAADVQHLLTMSSVAAEIELDKIPVCDGLQTLDSDTRWSLALTTGDDYELCFTMAEEYRDRVPEIISHGGCPVTYIGRIVTGNGVTWRNTDGSGYPLPGTGYRHF